MGKKPIVSVTYENERISMKNSLPYLKCVLRLSCVVHGPIYGRFMGFYVDGFLSINRSHNFVPFFPHPKSRTGKGRGTQRIIFLGGSVPRFNPGYQRFFSRAAGIFGVG